MHRIGGCHADTLHHVARELGRVFIKRAGNVWFPRTADIANSSRIVRL